MADRTFYPSYTYGFARVSLEFQFPVFTSGSLAMVFSGQSGTQNIFGVGNDVLSSITYSATGVYTVVLKDKNHYNKVIYASASVSDDGTNNAGAYATVGSVANEGSGTVGIQFVVRTYAAGGAATALTVAAGHVIQPMLIFRNSAGSNPA
jgi:hypothetical protein